MRRLFPETYTEGGRFRGERCTRNENHAIPVRHEMHCAISESARRRKTEAARNIRVSAAETGAIDITS